MPLSEFEFPYGTTKLKAKIPLKNVECVLRTNQTIGLSNHVDEIKQSLLDPISSAPLADRVNRGDKVVVLVTDNTRACPDNKLLPPILVELEKKVSRDDITIIVALGTHPPLTKEQLIAKLGKEIVQNYRVLNHDIKEVVYIGKTSIGTPVYINKIVLEADFRISTGFIEPHFFAGFSGGSKSIAPGVSSESSICKNHSFMMVEKPRSRTGITKGNPLREDIDEQAKIAKLNFIVNVLLNSNKEITHVVAGDPFIAHERGCEIMRGIAGVKVDREFDITITTNSGAPLDLDLYQSTKGIDTASRITRPGGVVIMVSSCSEGVGPDEFLRVHNSVETPLEVMQKIKREEPISAQWANQILARSQLKNSIYLVSNLDDIIVRKMMLIPVLTIEEGIAKALDVMGKDARIALVPEGPLVVPMLKT